MSAALLTLLLVACTPQTGGGHAGGHEHGGGHDHDGGHEHGGEDADGHGASLAITRWTPTHELFVELDAPVAGQPYAYHAHVTRLADNHAATEGALTIRFQQGTLPAHRHTDDAVARAGIFAQEATAPTTPGPHHLVFVYENGEERAEWDAGIVTVGAGTPVGREEEPEGEIGFLKETQWVIPFGVAPATERSLGTVVHASGVARPLPQSTSIVAAPAEGLVVWSSKAPVVGARVRRGERLATLVPASAAEPWARLEADRANARVELDLASRELERIDGLVSRDLLPIRRREEARARVDVAKAELDVGERRVGALTGTSGGGVAIRAPADGVIVEAGADHGSVVAPGQLLVSVAAGPGVLVEARVHERLAVGLDEPTGLLISRGGLEPIDVLATGGRLLTEQLVFDRHQWSAPVSIEVPGATGIAVGDRVDVAIQVGAAHPRVVVPRSAVVEINSTDVVFVQKTGESFTRRRVALGATDGQSVEILSGVEPGEMVVVEGGFDVHVASLSGALESHKH